MIINRVLKFIDKSINIVVTIVLLLFIIFSSYALYDSYYVYNGAKLSDDIKRLGPENEKFALTNLQEINSEICAWIRIDDTNIDYPMVIGKDNNEYLNKDYKKNYSTSGSIFLDYRNDRDFNDDYNIVYGHNLEADLMFSNIKKFENEDFFNSHPSGKLYTGNGNYQIDIICFERVDAFSSKVYGLDKNSKDRNREMIAFFEKNAIRKRTLEFTNDNKILLLSTCDAAGTNDRAVLICRLTKLNNDNEFIDSDLNTIDKKEKQVEKNNRIDDTIAPKQTVRVIKFNISIRNILLIILTIIVIIIFIILLTRKSSQRNKKYT